jgi:ubiquitin-conjugating enzyme E2 D/E
MAAPNPRLSRLAKERLKLERRPIDGVLVTWPGNSLDNLVVEITAPEDSIYHDDVFTVEITTNSYPEKPPRCVMKTPIFHPNIDTNGAICVAAIRAQYRPSVTLWAVIDEIVNALKHPNMNDELNIEAANLMKWDEEAFVERARAQVIRNCAERGS